MNWNYGQTKITKNGYTINVFTLENGTRFTVVTKPNGNFSAQFQTDTFWEGLNKSVSHINR